jgi:ubiquinol-cytochrome c reductase cytochrome b subunit
LLPIVLAGFVILHLLFLHKAGSNNPLGVGLYDDVKFFPYYVIKDLFGFFLFILCFVVIVFFYPNLLGHPDNYIKANPLCTPPHIVPE